MPQPLLQVKDLEITFTSRDRRSTRVAQGVSFQVSKGEILCLVGESGCGKSVSALSVLGLLPPQGSVTGGEILLDGQDLTRMKEKELDAIRTGRIGVIFQEIMDSLNPVFTIGRQLTEGIRCHLHLNKEDARNRAIELLKKTGLPDARAVMKKYPHQLSGGQRQRVMIAMALSCGPDLLIADEPTTALDVTIQLQIMQLLKKLRNEDGMAILLITHDIGVVAEMADRVAVMYAGQCVEEGSAEEVLTQPAHPYTQALLQAVPDLHTDCSEPLATIKGTVPDKYDDLPGCRFAPRCPHQENCPRTGEYKTLGENRFVRCDLAQGGKSHD